MRLRLGVAAVAAAVIVPFAVTARVGSGRHGDPPDSYRPPVERPISVPFRQPTSTYGPGHRGVDYATEPGEAVHAIGSGTVTFAGQVAHLRFVTIRHPDGLDSTYSYLATIAVRRGQHVAQGDVVGLAGGTLHLGVRRGAVYLDPTGLFHPHRRRAILVAPGFVRWPRAG
jgi:murein DD-endopeptidase MepM/ murein hydrolase activator NlpD